MLHMCNLLLSDKKAHLVQMVENPYSTQEHTWAPVSIALPFYICDYKGENIVTFG